MNIKKLALLIFLAVMAFCWTSSQSYALNAELDFHGKAESTAILRDITGFQYGLLDDNRWVGWKTQLQFDLGIRPQYDLKPALRIEKVYFSFRGNYDAIYELDSSRYAAVPTDRSWGSGSRYDMTRDDVMYETDLRELFIDITLDAGASGTTTANAHARLGRQIIQWGEADGFNLVNIVNPQDLKSIAAFANPDELACPIWMGRFDFNTGAVGAFANLSAQLLAIPDNRPTIWGPPGSAYGLGLTQNDHASDLGNMQYGVRLGALYKDLSTYLYYFAGYENHQGAAGGLNFATGAIDHPRINMYGMSFTVPWDYWYAMIRGEASLTTDSSWTDLSSPTAYSAHQTFKAYLGIDKPFHPPLGTDSALNVTVQFFYQKIDDWEFGALRPGIKDNSYHIIANFGNDYYHGQIAPGLFVWYDLEGSYLLSPSIKYSPDGRWVFKVSATMYLGDPNSASKFAPYIGGNDELAFNVLYQW